MQLLMCQAVGSVDVGAVVQLPAPEARHATASLRMSTGEQVIVSDGRGRKAIGTLEVDGSVVSAVIVSIVDEPAANPSLTVVQALAKGDHGELAIDQMTQVGVDRIIPWASQRAIVQLKGDRADKALIKWQQTARAATKQARRAWMPVVSPVRTTKEILGQLTEFDAVFLLHEDASIPLSAAELPESGLICLIVGPEGGIAPDEQEWLAEAGARPVRLGTEVLRSSLAGAVGASVIASRLRWAAPPGAGVGG